MTEKASLLESIRLERDWSYLELSNAIEDVTGLHRNQDCWRKICNGETSTPQGRTARILDKFLARMKGERRRSA